MTLEQAVKAAAELRPQLYEAWKAGVIDFVDLGAGFHVRESNFRDEIHDYAVSNRMSKEYPFELSAEIDGIRIYTISERE